MTINKKLDGSKLYAQVNGRIDTVTVTEADMILKADLDKVTDLTLDFKGLDYISSAGLRLLLSLQKQMNKQGSMKIVNVNETVMEIFEVTGFSDILTIE
jgi:anti-sigma B factor antagonist